MDGFYAEIIFHKSILIFFGVFVKYSFVISQSNFKISLRHFPKYKQIQAMVGVEQTKLAKMESALRGFLFDEHLFQAVQEYLLQLVRIYRFLSSHAFIDGGKIEKNPKGKCDRVKGRADI